MKRNRIWYAVLGLLTIGLGLASRQFAPLLPAWIGAYAGDALWALLVFWLVGFGWPRWGSSQVAAVALGFAFCIECSQLYHVSWLDALRHTRPGRLVLGQGFLWSDLLCYTLGVLIGVGLEQIWLRPARLSSLRNPRTKPETF
ncbi:ribosomal maturation YjgA family protein [Hymenobacter sublimis]|uniref:DUF2809 domain-containing protein n=1 Tax=Hymenobacter sublimis TaxID=2933777 RepID=A0ABY4JCT7_9BACT|nr:DUF2809 domain-containing protein [Hymenobacter sublimis]UPL50633.1 DUF2809 domain-containing protein [Hymenobacter sublimis]